LYKGKCPICGHAVKSIWKDRALGGLKMHIDWHMEKEGKLPTRSWRDFELRIKKE